MEIKLLDLSMITVHRNWSLSRAQLRACLVLTFDRFFSYTGCDLTFDEHSFYNFWLKIPGFFDVVQSESSGPYTENHSKLSYTEEN